MNTKNNSKTTTKNKTRLPSKRGKKKRGRKNKIVPLCVAKKGTKIENRKNSKTTTKNTTGLLCKREKGKGRKKQN
jgi:hypothetical protein